MSCADYLEWISADLDGELSPSESAQLNRHLSGCAKCRQIHEDYKVNRILVAAMEPKRAPADAWARLCERIEGQAAVRPHGRVASMASTPSLRRSWRRNPWVRAFRAVAAVVVVFLGTLTWLGWTDPDAPPAAPPQSMHVRPKTLIRGHAYLQSANPVADRSAWHYLASEEENSLTTSDDDEEINQSSDAGRRL